MAVNFGKTVVNEQSHLLDVSRLCQFIGVSSWSERHPIKTAAGLAVRLNFHFNSFATELDRKFGTGEATLEKDVHLNELTEAFSKSLHEDEHRMALLPTEWKYS